MKTFLICVLLLFTVSTIISKHSYAQMMGSTPSQDAIAETQNDQDTGKKLLEQLQQKRISCQDLTNDEFEKIDEYDMGKNVGDTKSHAAMNSMMQSMMGQQGEEQMHINMGKQASGCFDNTGGDQGMMGMMRYGVMPFGGVGIVLGLLLPLLFIIFLILVIIALFKWIQSSGKHVPLQKRSLEILRRHS